MKALTIRQPWAWLIVEGHKKIENRTWHASYRGPLIIHAGTYYRKKEYDAICESVKAKYYIDIPTKDNLHFGGIIGKTKLVMIDHLPPNCTWMMKPFEEGPYCWYLSDPKRTIFVPYKGKLGLFDIDEKIFEKV